MEGMILSGPRLKSQKKVTIDWPWGADFVVPEKRNSGQSRQLLALGASPRCNPEPFIAFGALFCRYAISKAISSQCGRLEVATLIDPIEVCL